MPKEIYPSSYECDCGHVAHFFEHTVAEVRKRSLAKRQWLSADEGNAVSSFLDIDPDHFDLAAAPVGELRGFLSWADRPAAFAVGRHQET